MNLLSSKKILITGGLGFIGSNLARRLVECENEVSVVDSLIPEYGGNPRNLHDFHDKIQIYLSDIRDAKKINELIKGQDYIFNLAGQTSHLDSMENPFTDLDINAKAQLSILEACRSIILMHASFLLALDKFMGGPSICPLMKNTHGIQSMLMASIRLPENNTIYYTTRFTGLLLLYLG